MIFCLSTRVSNVVAFEHKGTQWAILNRSVSTDPLQAL